MKIPHTIRLLGALVLLQVPQSTSADPILTSWFTEKATQYARVYESTEDEVALNAVSTWELGQGVQDTAVYADINAISYSDDWVYVYTSGLSSHVMGPWYFTEEDSIVFANFPANQNRLYRISRNPEADTDGDLETTTAGLNGIYVNGVALFDMTDTFSYDTDSGFDGTTGDQNDPNGPDNAATVTVSQDGIWNRDAFTNEAVTFDPTNTHQAGSNYHYHANPVGLRHQLGDSVDYDATTNRYTENFNGEHSPIIAWVADGFPLYGPYGYSDPTDATSDVRRMISGFQKRDGTNGSTNLADTGRTTLPQWAADLQGIGPALTEGQYGPDVDSQVNWNVYELHFETAVLGRYLEDHAYKGDLDGLNFYEGVSIDGAYTEGTHYDLNLNNGRFCVTPEYPEGIFAYFLPIESDGTPAYPYSIGREFYGNVTATSETSITETVTEHFSVTNTFLENVQSIDSEGDTVSLVWNALEGGTYTVESSLSLDDDWADETTTAKPVGNDLEFEDADILANAERKFYRITRTSLDDSDTIDGAGSGDSGGPGGGGPGGGGPPR